MRLAPSPEQQAVIGQPLHSFRVAAGAGTGKTTTMAMRVVELVTHHGIEPEQILGVTFTNKAAGELAERIAGWLAGEVEGGREVEVHTYHGFAAQILGEYGALAGIERDTKLVTPTFARQILFDVVQSAPITTWDLGNVYMIDRVATFGGQLADHLRRAGDIPIPELGFDEVWAKRADLLAVLRLYEQEKARMGVADYGDLITAAWRVVAGHPEIAAAIADRYRAVVLDEYQDTNPAQRELLREIFGGRVPVTAVGDADQTIYEWRGASLQNFAEFGTHFPNGDLPAPSLPLTTNRRSGAAILDVANEIKRLLSPDPDPLVPVAGTPPGLVSTAWLRTAADEASWIAEQIERLVEGGTPYGEIAVLFRKNKDMQIVHDALSQRDIPFEVANLGGLLSVPEVTDLVAWLRILARPEDTVALVRILTGSRYRLGLADLARLSDWVRRRRQEVDDDIEGLPDYTLVEALEHLGEIDGLRDEAGAALRQFHAEHTTFLADAQGLSLVELCRTILDRTRAWQDIEAMPRAAGLSARLNLFRFLDLTESWSPLEGRPSLAAFTNYLELMADNPREELDTARISEADAVTLITVHRAKGLEWDAVLIPATYHDNFPSRYRGEDPYTSADILPFEFRLDRDSLPPIDAATPKDERNDALRARHLDAEWRLAYVAVTRARQQLFVSGAWWYGHPMPLSRPCKPSELYEIAARSGLVTRSVDEPGERPERTAYRPHTETPDPGFAEGWAEALRAGLADPHWPRQRAEELGLADAYDAAVSTNEERLFSLPEPPPTVRPTTVETSATGLVTYAACPRRFEWSFVDPLPRRGSDAARRGTEVHRRIELHNRGVMTLDEFDEVSYDVVGDGDVPLPGVDPFQAFERSAYAARTPGLTETPFDLIRPQGRVRGRIDAVYVDDENQWEVVDFKSGRERADTTNLVQLQVYALAATEADFGLPSPTSLSVSFVYLGNGEARVRSHTVDTTWLEAADTNVAGLLSGIAAEDWGPTPSAQCTSCDFLRFCDAGQAHVGRR